MLGRNWETVGILPELNRMRNEMARLLARGNGDRRFSYTAYPALNLWEDNGHLYVEAELPGFELSDLEITLPGEDQLSIKGERKEPELPNATWHRQERGYGSFSRLIELPQRVDADKVTAEFKYGVLTISLPKREAAKPRHIEVKGG
jgi:HSP20 family protein